MSFRVLTRNALSSAVQVIISSTILFLLYWLLNRYLAIADIGLWSLVMASTSVARLSEFGLGGGVMRFVASDMADEKHGSVARTIGMAVMMVTILSVVVCLMLFVPLKSLIESVVPVTDVENARYLLPYALNSFVVGAVSGVFLNALDGLQKTHLRVVAQISGSIAQLLCAIVFVPDNGLRSLGPIQIVQAVVVLMISSSAIFVDLRQPITKWIAWDRARARDLIRYGGGLQVAAVGQLLFEPTVKGCLTIFGGLALTGYYEMANRLLLQLRSVIVSAYTVLVPYITGRINRSASGDSEVGRIYLHSYRFLFLIANPYYGLIGASLPLALSLWRGRFEPGFLLIAFLCWCGWFLNTMVAPAYFLYLAIGKLRWNISSQVAIGLLNAVLAWAGGNFLGGYGVLIGSTIALVVGSFLVTVAFHHEYGIAIKELLPQDSVVLVIFCIVGTFAQFVLAIMFHDSKFWMAVSFGGLVMYLLGICFIMFRHPFRAIILSRLSSS